MLRDGAGGAFGEDPCLWHRRARDVADGIHVREAGREIRLVDRGPVDAGPDAGIGIPQGEMTLMLMLRRTPRPEKYSSSNIAASQGAGGHLKGSLRTATTTLPDVTAGSTSRSRRAPATEENSGPPSARPGAA